MKKLRLVQDPKANSWKTWAQPPVFLTTTSMYDIWGICQTAQRAVSKARSCVSKFTVWFLLCSTGYAFSEDGEYFAYGLSASGSDWVTIKFMKVDGAKELPDVLERVKFSCMAWTHDGKGMFYNSYPQQDGKSDGKLRLPMKVPFSWSRSVAHVTLKEKLNPSKRLFSLEPRFLNGRMLYQCFVCNRSPQNLLVLNKDHLFLFVSLWIDQAILLGFAEFYHASDQL